MYNMEECKRYDNLMSLKLDGALDAEKERAFNEHVFNCANCAPLWEAMQDADNMLWGWVKESAPVPVNFHVKVMAQVSASPISRPQLAPAYTNVAGEAVPHPTRPLSMLTGPLGSAPGPLTLRLSEWQGRVAPYVRWLAAAGFALAGITGLVMALIVSGALQFEGPLQGISGALRTFFQAADTWVRSLFVGIGPAMFAVGGLIFGIMALAGWQVVHSYQRSLLEHRRGTTGHLEALV